MSSHVGVSSLLRGAQAECKNSNAQQPVRGFQAVLVRATDDAAAERVLAKAFWQPSSAALDSEGFSAEAFTRARPATVVRLHRATV